MRVLHLEGGRSLYGGALQALLLVEGLEGRGVENLLVVPRGSEVEAEARRRGLPLHPLPMAGEADLLLPLRLRRLILAWGPSLVHLHSRRGADTLGAVAARWAGVPAVLSRRVDNPEPPWLARLRCRLVDVVVAISEAIREVLLAQGVPPEKVRCVPSALNPAPFRRPCDDEAFRRELGLEAGDQAVGMAAQFIPRKGHRVLLQAIPPILESHPRARFLLFGRGPLQEEIRRRVRREGLEGAVRFPGFREDLPRLLPCLDLLVHPATMEGLGVILLQASAAGVPIVASRAGGIPEAVWEGENGLLVPPGDPVALAAAVTSLLGDPDRSRTLGAGGRALVEREFSPGRMVEGNLAVYRELLGGAPPMEHHS